MPEVEAVVAAWDKAWAESHEDERRRLLETAFSETGVYGDEMIAEVAGREALMSYIASFLQRRAGFRLLRTSGVQHYGDRFHFTWAMLGPDGATVLEGRDFGELDGDGRIRRIVGFFGPPPALPSQEAST